MTRVAPLLPTSDPRRQMRTVGANKTLRALAKAAIPGPDMDPHTRLRREMWLSAKRKELMCDFFAHKEITICGSFEIRFYKYRKVLITPE